MIQVTNLRKVTGSRILIDESDLTKSNKCKDLIFTLDEIIDDRKTKT